MNIYNNVINIKNTKANTPTNSQYFNLNNKQSLNTNNSINEYINECI